MGSSVDMRNTIYLASNTVFSDFQKLFLIDLVGHADQWIFSYLIHGVLRFITLIIYQQTNHFQSSLSNKIYSNIVPQDGSATNRRSLNHLIWATSNPLARDY